ncbi:MsnO8 family LLM class oxidoreductase [Acinetobacter qingfengensis]|uniref:Alkane 1-monooxygenase n=1 Tax=Acinetobacter qingfengensis TaxID=1262585 RepID=A0A1E7R420_9GAMM|nr:MsnO8 family LLM class oxidoreductase [Acinetobacter qingfengensis]KAA8733741.1 MsnO8 family LLM class oxidoreductase [Acinetobacter qingfengensis]OEY94046.1 alkane 1-monooxygenase [Acinetobacter qingfengensis]
MGLGYKLSILDKCPRAEGISAEQAFHNAREIVQTAENLGFHRYWIAEHHASAALASPSPEILIAWLLAQTKRIRIGSGGVMLQHYSPYKVAENFNVLASLANDRIDLGIGKAPGGFPVSTKALQIGLDQAQKGDFKTQLAALDHYLNTQTHPEDSTQLIATPVPHYGAERFLLGASIESAQLAAELGWNFVFAAHLNGDTDLLKQALHTFFEASGGKKALVAVQIIVADSQEQAETLTQGLSVWTLELENGQRVKILNEQSGYEFSRQAGSAIKSLKQEQLNVLKGTVGDVHQQLQALHQQYGIDEFIVESPVLDHETRLKALTLLAKHKVLAA